MASLNRPLTAAELASLPTLITADPSALFSNIFQLINEPHYQCVRYDAAVPRVEYMKRDTFYWTPGPSPSDCVWMMPGQERIGGPRDQALRDAFFHGEGWTKLTIAEDGSPKIERIEPGAQIKTADAQESAGQVEPG